MFVRAEHKKDDDTMEFSCALTCGMRKDVVSIVLDIQREVIIIAQEGTQIGLVATKGEAVHLAATSEYRVSLNVFSTTLAILPR